MGINFEPCFIVISAVESSLFIPMAEYGQLQISAKGLAQIWHFSDKAHTPAHNLTQTAGGLSSL